MTLPFFSPSPSVTPRRVAPLTELGTSGLQHSGGWITQEFLQELTGARGLKMYREMRDNSPVIGAILYAIEMLARETGWRVEAGDDEDETTRLFVEECLGDMSTGWDDTLSDILSCLVYGFSYHEIVYKRRNGANPAKPGLSSNYRDGKLGWRKWAIRSQLTVWRWLLDERGGLRGLEQYDPSASRSLVTIPIEKALLFRPFAYLQNPEGRSILRNAYLPYYYTKRIGEIEAIGIERDLAGLPVVKIPAEVMQNDTQMAAWKKVVQDIKRNEQAGVVLPSDRDEHGEPMFELTLLTTGGERQIDTNQVLQRYETRILQSVLADFIQMGQTQVGTQSLAQTKAGLFATAMGALLDSIASVVNRHAIPRLLQLNGMRVETAPRLVFDDIEYEDVAAWTEALGKLAAAGMPLFPDPLLENVVRAKLDLPELTEEEIEERKEQDELQADRDDRLAEAGVLGAEAALEQPEEAKEEDEEEDDVSKAAPDIDTLADRVVAKLPPVPDYTPQFEQLTLTLGEVGDRLAKTETKATETAVAVQGLCYQQEATEARLAKLDDAEHVASVASAAAAKVTGLEPPPPVTAEMVADAVQKGVAPLIAAVTRPRTKTARKLPDGSVEITES